METDGSLPVRFCIGWSAGRSRVNLAKAVDILDNVDTENLKRVWERVAPETPEPEPAWEPDIVVRLRGFIENERDETAMDGLLVLKTRGSRAEKTLRSILEDERRHERRLQSAYFLLIGDTYAPPARHPSAPYLLKALRERYMGETAGAEAYDRAAAETDDESLREALREIAADERRHAGLLRSMIEGIIY